MAFTGSLYLWAFIGFVSVPEEGIDEEERRALLRREDEIQEAAERTSSDR